MFHFVFSCPCKLSKMLFLLHFVLLSGAFVDSTTKGCISSNGVGYRGDLQISSTGQTCLNWTNTSRDYDVTLHSDSENGVGDHNYCRNPDSSKQPWCYVAGPKGDVQRRSCAIETCIDQAAPAVPAEAEKKAEAEVEADPLPSEAEADPVPSEAEADPLPAVASTPQTQSFEPVKSAPAQGEDAAVQTVMGISQRVRTGPKKKKDLGTLGYVLGIFMMVIIILLGVGITVGYFYKRGRDLKKQHEQRVYEREMQRITLPLSAFSNPTCELVDENTIVITAGEQTPNQEEMEGGDPLMGQAGTPGA